MWKNKRAIEIPLTLSCFAAILIGGSLDTNFIIYRTCYAELNNNETDCAKLGSSHKDNSSDKLELEVEPYSNIIIMVLHTLMGIVPAISGLFIGPWSDTHGRKPVMLIALIGTICTFLIKLIVILIPEASPWFLLLEVIPTLFSGGFSTFIMICMCYVIDITTKEDVGTRIGFVEIVMAISLIFANAMSSFLFNATGYSTVYSICLAVQITALSYIYFFIEDTSRVEKGKQEDNKIFSLAQIKDIWITVKKYRPNNQRKILLLLFIISLLNAAILSHMSIMFPFMRLQFKWTLQKFTLFVSAYAIINIAGTFFGIYVLHKLLKISEIPLVLLVYINHTIACIFVLNAKNDIFLFVGLGFQFLNGLLSPMIKSLVSKMIPHEEVGKIFSFAYSLDSIAGLIASPIFTFIYNSTINTFPAAFYIIDTVFYAVNIILVIAIWILLKEDARNRSHHSTSTLAEESTNSNPAFVE